MKRWFWPVVVLVVIIAGLAFEDYAQAQTPAEKVTMEAAGAKTFPNSVCQSRVVLVPSTMDELKVMTGWAPPTPEPGGAAMQNNAAGDCKVFILDTLLANDPYGACKVYVHEYGHLAGAHHGEPLMGENGDAFAPCLLMTPVVTAYRAKLALRAKIGTKLKGARYRARCYSGGPGTGAVCELSARLKRNRFVQRVYAIEQVRLGDPYEITLL